MIEVSLENKVTGYVVNYDNVIAYDTHGADDDGPVFHFILNGGETATYHKDEWYCMIREWVELV